MFKSIKLFVRHVITINAASLSKFFPETFFHICDSLRIIQRLASDLLTHQIDTVLIITVQTLRHLDSACFQTKDYSTAITNKRTVLLKHMILNSLYFTKVLLLNLNFPVHLVHR